MHPSARRFEDVLILPWLQVNIESLAEEGESLTGLGRDRALQAIRQGAPSSLEEINRGLQVYARKQQVYIIIMTPKGPRSPRSPRTLSSLQGRYLGAPHEDPTWKGSGGHINLIEVEFLQPPKPSFF